MQLEGIHYTQWIEPEWEKPVRPITVLLLQPPNIGGIRSLLSHMGESGDSIGFKPPLGLLYIATYLRKDTGHDVHILDAQARRMDFDACLRHIMDLQPEVIGISAWTDWWYSAYHLGLLIKQHCPSVHLCYGGPHVSIFPEETLASSPADSIIVGDGEVPFAFLCNMISNRTISQAFPGLHFKGRELKRGDRLFFIQADLDALPIPDRTLLPIRDYTSVLSPSGLVTTMITSRGCPHRCTYCKLFFQKTISRSAGNVMEEFRQIKRLGIDEVEIYDDTFTISRERVREICNGLIGEGLQVQWAIRDRVNKADAAILDLMKKAGCSRIHYGIESGVDRILKKMKKNITTDQARRAVALAKAEQFTTLTYFMIGNLDETVEDIRKTIDFALELDADYAEFSITIPYPGTELYLESLAQGIISQDYWRPFALHPAPDFNIPQLIENSVGLDELLQLRNEAIRRYYFRPVYLCREIRKVATWGEFQRKAKMGVRLLKSLFMRGNRGRQANG
jgi:anaerobic magnesium-protoporphyrin IX monomethyl ester cyclase